MPRWLQICASLFATINAAAPDAEASGLCPEGRGVYLPVSGSAHELAFAGQTGTLTFVKGKTRLAFPFAITSSNGFSRTYLNFQGKDAPTTVMMSFNPDFTGYRGEGSASYIVLPDLPVGFHYWEPFRSRPDAYDLLPSDAWRLARCTVGER